MAGIRGSVVRVVAQRVAGGVAFALVVLLPVPRAPAGGTFIRKVTGPHAQSQFGDAIAPIEDVDGDGVGDLIVGVTQRMDPVSGVFVLSGADGSVLRTFDGENNSDLFGWAVVAIDDMDGRGTDDILVGAPNGSTDIGTAHRTYAKVFAGEDGAVLFDSGDMNADSRFGHAVARLGDFTGDGIDEFAVGQPWTGNTSPRHPPGSVLVYSGSDGTLLHTLQGEVDGDEFGSTIVPLSDVDGDSVPDIAVGSIDDRPGDGRELGRLTVFSGADFVQIRVWRDRKAFGHTLTGLARDGPHGGLLAIPHRRSLEIYDAATGRRRVLRPSGARPVLGSSIASVGDIDGDQSPDLAILAVLKEELFSSDYALLAEVHSGRTGQVLFSLRTLPGEAPTLSAAGDLDGDGIQELAVGFQTRNELALYKLGPAPAPTLLRFALQRVPGDTDPDAYGVVEIGPRSLERPFCMEVFDMDTVPLIFAFLETSPGSGDFVDLERLINTESLSDWVFHGVDKYFVLPDEIRFRTLQEFDGCRVEVRDWFGTAHLRAVIRAEGVRNFSGRSILDCPEPDSWPNARGSVQVRSRHRRGTAKLTIRAAGVSGASECRAWIEDAIGSGTFVDSGVLEGGRLVLDTNHSDTLPGWVPDGPSLSGRLIEIRDGATVLLAGTLP